MGQRCRVEGSPSSRESFGDESVLVASIESGAFHATAFITSTLTIGQIGSDKIIVAVSLLTGGGFSPRGPSGSGH